MTTLPRENGLLTTASQRARRERILAATVELASHGGFDSVQMREVADKAEVALGTLYRYFPSKIHLLVSAMAEEVERIRDRALRQPPTSNDPCERVLQVLERAFRALQRAPGFSSAMVRAVMSADETVAEEVERVTNAMTSLVTIAMYGQAHEPDEHDRLVANVIGKVWLTDIQSWLSGRTTPEQMWADLSAAVRLILRG